MPTIIESEAHKHVCPFRGFEPCLGARCMAWIWAGRPYQRETTTNLVNTSEGKRPDPAVEPPMPEGEGWMREGQPHLAGYEGSAKLKLPKATAQLWVRPIKRASGGCSRLGADAYGEGLPF